MNRTASMFDDCSRFHRPPAQPALIGGAAVLRPDWRIGAPAQRGRPAADNPVQPTMNRLRGFTEEMTELGYRASSVVLARDRVRSSPVRDMSEGPHLRLERVRKANDTTMSHETGWYDLTAVPELATADGSTSIYGLMRAAGKPLVRCEQTIEAVMPTPLQMKAFGFADPVPCLLVRRRSYAADGRLVEYVDGVFRGDAYVLHLHLQAAQSSELQVLNLGKRFQLTPAEIRAAQEIIKGDGRAAAAERLGITEASIKTHLGRVFEKVGVSRQAELIRLILMQEH